MFVVQGQIHRMPIEGGHFFDNCESGHDNLFFLYIYLSLSVSLLSRFSMTFVPYIYIYIYTLFPST